MNRYEKLIIILPALADICPLVYYALSEKVWHAIPFVVAIICTFAPQGIGIFILIILPILRYRGVIPRRSDSTLIGSVLAIVGVLEPFFFY